MTFEEASTALKRISMDENTRKDRFVVAFCGVFSSGKSSLLNALLEDSGLRLPTGIVPITKLVTRIRYGETLRYTYTAGHLLQLHEMSAGGFASLVKEQCELPSGCEELVIEAPARLLKTGLELLDTPGFDDEMGGELEKRTRDAMAQADMMVLCTSALALGKQFERELIGELEASPGNFCLIVNGMDRLNTSEDAQDVREVAQRLMKEKGGETLRACWPTPIFYTSADGPRRSVTAFAKAFHQLVCDLPLRMRLKLNAAGCIERSRKQALALECDAALEKLRARRQALLEKRDALKQEEKLNQLERSRECERLLSTCTAMLNESPDQLATILRSYATPDGVASFVENANRAVVDYYSCRFVELNQLLPAGCRLSDHFTRCCSAFSAVKPTLTHVLERGTAGRIGETILNFLDGWFQVDDGYTWKYVDYEKPTVDKIRQELVPELIGAAENAVDRYRSSLPSAVPELDAEMSGVEKECARWSALRGETEKYTARSLLLL